MGLSGSGKSSLAKAVVKKIQEKKPNVILIDGDEFREVFGNDLGYTKEDRKKNATRISKFCKFCELQNIHVVCAILSIFPEIRNWNKNNLLDYYEVFIDAAMDDLKIRDSKRLYEKFDKKIINNVVGLDIEFKKPDDSDLIIKNDNSLEYLLSHAEFIAQKIKNKK